MLPQRSVPCLVSGLFKDFYQLAEYSRAKKKYVYVLGKEYPLKFLNC